MRRVAGPLAGLALLVGLGHLGVLGWLGAQLAASADVPPMARMEAIYTRTVALSAPPVAGAAPQAAGGAAARAARPAAPPAPQAASAPPQAASGPPAEASAPVALAEVAITPSGMAPAPQPPAPSGPAFDPQAEPGTVAGAPPDLARAMPASAPAPSATASASATPAAGAASGPAFAWPGATRLRYSLLGWYQGEVHGSAQVEWLRAGDRYQVHLDVIVGPSLAPLVSRRMSSEGLVTPAGLRPLRYEQETRQIVGRTRTARLALDPGTDRVSLPDGRSMPARPDVQDTASQFIQMVFLFSTRPELRRTGQRVEFDLALPHRVRRWVYEVGEFVPVSTPLGDLETFHVRPVPITTALPEARAESVREGGSILSAQIWYAPTLQMLPVRIRIEQDAQTWVDLRLSEPPTQADAP